MTFLNTFLPETFNFTGFLFYVFAGILLTSACMVVTARNAVHSVLFLILAFFNAAGLFILVGAEFLAMMLVVVYVGAVAVLFLFVVMMLNVNLTVVKERMAPYKMLGFVLGGVFVIELILVMMGWVTPKDAGTLGAAASHETVSNTHALGALLYTHYMLIFQLAGMILLVAMVGAIVLTLRDRPGLRRQNIRDQLARDKRATLELKHMPIGKGV